MNKGGKFWISWLKKSNKYAIFGIKFFLQIKDNQYYKFVKPIFSKFKTNLQ